MSSKKRRLTEEARSGGEPDTAQCAIDYKTLYEEALAKINVLEEKVESLDFAHRCAVSGIRQERKRSRATADVIDDLKRAQILLRENNEKVKALCDKMAEDIKHTM